MRLLKRKLFLPFFLIGSLFSLPVSSSEGHHHDHHGHNHDHHQQAHEHGIAAMQLVIVEDDVLVEVKSPLFNVIGFEHEARNQEQTNAIKKQLAKIDDGTLIQFNNKAQCKLTGKHLHHPFKHVLKDNQHKHNHDADHDSNTSHRDLSFEYQFKCKQPKALKSINTQALFQSWNNLQKLRVEWVYHNHQSAITLNRKHPVILFE